MLTAGGIHYQFLVRMNGVCDELDRPESNVSRMDSYDFSRIVQPIRNPNNRAGRSSSEARSRSKNNAAAAKECLALDNRAVFPFIRSGINVTMALEGVSGSSGDCERL